MTLQSGALNKRVRLETRSVGTDVHGGQLDVFTPWITVWGRIETISGKALGAAESLQVQVTHEIQIRYRPGVIAPMRAIYQNRYFDIVAVLDPDESHFELLLLCVEGTSRG
jgi:SPP1 family predicted phage head-tail adaptor